MSDRIPDDVAFMLAAYRSAPYISEKKPPHYTGDMALKDGARRITTVEDLGKYLCGEDDWFVWDGEKWVNMLTQPTYNVQQ